MPARRRRLSGSATATLVGLAGFAIGSLATLALDYFVLGVFIPAALLVAVALLAVAGVVATGLRWAPALGAMVAAVLLVGTFQEGVGLQRLLAPENPWLFASTVLMTLSGLVTVTAGLSATYRHVASHHDGERPC